MSVFLFLVLLMTTASLATPTEPSSCAFVTIALPPEKLNASIESRQSNFVRDSIVYLSRSSVVPEGLADFKVGDSSFTVPAERIPHPFVSFFGALAAEKDPMVVFDRLTSHEYTQIYLATRSHRHLSFRVPDFRRDLETQLGYAEATYLDDTPEKWIGDTSGLWFRKIVLVSIPKGVERRLYRPQAAHPLFGTGKSKITIATTINETEVALMREDGSGDWDYYGYGADGRLSPVGAFKTSTHVMSEANSPHACMACHYSVGQRRFRGTR